LKRITVFGKDTLIEELAYFPFNSDRKRASIIIRHEGRVKILMKGADSLVIARLGHFSNDAQPYVE
jgi:phospholipid-translocating ATPase